jgi:imidazole glycerol-phosphate synthase subunit HisH
MIQPSVVIVDYGIGNLFSVVGAVKAVGVDEPVVSSDISKIGSADRVILPGVGAFGDGMDNLRERDLVSVLQDRSAADRPTLGVCLGMQLLMDGSDEFGVHDGLGAIRGTVTRFAPETGMKIPLIGWERLIEPEKEMWNTSVLSELAGGTHMYFVHSYYVDPAEDSNVLATTRFGEFEFCSVVREGNTTGVQFHPERSGEDGIQIYRNFLFGND